MKLTGESVERNYVQLCRQPTRKVLITLCRRAGWYALLFFFAYKYKAGVSCSKLTTSLVNVSLIFLKMLNDTNPLIFFTEKM